MAVALAYPESKQGKKNKETSVFNTEVSDSYLKHARFVLRNCRDKAEEVLRAYPAMREDNFSAGCFSGNRPCSILNSLRFWRRGV